MRETERRQDTQARRDGAEDAPGTLGLQGVTRFREWLFDYDPQTWRGFLWELVLIVPDAIAAVVLMLVVGVALIPIGFVLYICGASPHAIAFVVGIPAGLSFWWYRGFPWSRPSLWWLGNTKRIGR